MTFWNIIVLRNKTVVHTFLPSFDKEILNIGLTSGFPFSS